MKYVEAVTYRIWTYTDIAIGFSLIEEIGLTDGEQQPGHVWRSFMSSCQKSSLPSQ